jgi:hypothetical protein
VPVELTELTELSSVNVVGLVLRDICSALFKDNFSVSSYKGPNEKIISE